jgi:hypothetical protein
MHIIAKRVAKPILMLVTPSVEFRDAILILTESVAAIVVCFRPGAGKVIGGMISTQLKRLGSGKYPKSTLITYINPSSSFCFLRLFYKTAILKATKPQNKYKLIRS